MLKNRVQVNSIVENQVPSFIREDFPLVSEFLKQYYISLESQGLPLDLIQNIDQYLRIDELTNITEETFVYKEDDNEYSISFFDDEIFVKSTYGFPDKYGLIKIDNEIITYTSKTDTSFIGCIRGFSGVEEYESNRQLKFSETESEEHTNESTVYNLSILFLKQFFNKIKKLYLPGFEDRELDVNLNKNLFIKQSKDFYSSKGTDESFNILFKSLYGENVEVIKPRDYLIQPSDAQYRLTKDLVVEVISGNPLDLVNRTLFQDQIYDIKKSYGSVTNVEKIVRGGKEYYIVSLDYDFDKDISVTGSIFNDFSIHPKTQLTKAIPINETVVTVDSTIGFPKSGELTTKNNNGTDTVFTYTSKTYNQFLGCSGIDQELPSGQEIALNVFAYAFINKGLEDTIKVRVTGVLSELNLLSDNDRYYLEDDSIKITTLGKEKKDFKFNNWIFNISLRQNIESFIWKNSVPESQPLPSGLNYEITTIDENNLYVGDIIDVDLIYRDFNNENVRKTEQFSINSVVIPSKTFIITYDKKIENIFSVRKVTNTFKVSNSYLQEVNDDIIKYTSDVQSVYESGESLYVTSSSLPNYFNENININDRSVVFSGSFLNSELISIQNHGFLTGDLVYYLPGSGSNKLNILKGTYYIFKDSNDTIKLSNSKENLFLKNYISLTGNITNNKLVPFEFIDEDLNIKQLDSQRLVRKIDPPSSDGKIYPTRFGKTGILVNGVEILNYKSKDYIFYGPITSIDPTSGGSDYDVINPPLLEIQDSNGSGASGICEVDGSLERIDIIESGFDYISNPIITITGGNGTGAVAKANLITFEHSVNFNSESTSGYVNLNSNMIGFSTDHKFRNNEKVFYQTNGGNSIGGLSNSTSYYINIQNRQNITLHTKLQDSILGINTINLTSYGTGVHSFKSSILKKKIGSINIINPGSGYRNRKIIVPLSGINTSRNLIECDNHNYSSGDVIVYSSSGTVIEGLQNNQSYFVTKIDSNSFRLSNVGFGTDDYDFYYKTNQYVDLKSSGSGIHEFNYPKIVVKVEGITGVSTTNQNLDAVVQPIFRGKIKSIFLTSQGVGYGSSEIINYDRKPQIKLNSGKGANLSAIVSNGKISQVLILNSGSGYNSPPNLVVTGSGYGCILTPVLNDGKIIDVKVINGGYGYESNKTSITVISSGSNCSLNANIQSWNINIVERLRTYNKISEDGGIITEPLNQNYGLQYTHPYASKKLRKKLFSKSIEDEQIKYRSDLDNDTSPVPYHSPIIGWSYDGHPIYGPYGYEFSNGGKIKRLISGYSSPSLSLNRPSIDIFPLGFFVEDYKYSGNGDLDEFNGRFCVTPEFPNGTYAYFSSIDSQFNPVFPYLIGNNFKSKEIEFNRVVQSNQDDLDIENINWIKNTFPYKISSDNSEYEFLSNPNKIKEQVSNINYTQTGYLQDVIIASSGEKYKVGDQIIFDNEGTGGQGAYAVVSSIKGKEVEKIESNYIEINNVEFENTSISGEILAISPIPHNLNTNEIISLTGISTYYANLQNYYSILVDKSQLILSEFIDNSSVTGIVTYFNVYGSLNTFLLKENDVFEIDEEKVKVLNIDQESSRIKVIREYDNTFGSSHIAGSLLTEDSRKFRFKTNLNLNLPQSNTEIYFNPAESVSLGSVGIGTTIQFSNPGVGITNIFVPIKTIYLKDHNLQTGDSVIYNSNGGLPLTVSNSINSFDLEENQILYVAKISNNFVGLSTNKIGIGSDGSFVGVGTTTSTLYFTSKGFGDNHSLKTDKSSLVGTVKKNNITVTTKENHNLQLGDSVNINCSPTSDQTIVIKYSNYIKKLLVDPKIIDSDSIDTNSGIISIENHNYKTGDKVLYTSSLPSLGLINNQIYFIIVINKNQIKLSENYYNSIKNTPISIDITNQSIGILSKINPEILLIRNKKIVFDLSDSSLSYITGSQKYPAFDFKLFYDSNFTNEFVSSFTNPTFDINKIGNIGDSGARIELTLNDNIPNLLYYTLVPTIDSPYEIEIDDENIINHNKLTIKESLYNGQYNIDGITDNTFKFTSKNDVEQDLYSEGILYTTNSKTADGGIEKIDVKISGSKYKKLPVISKIISSNGSKALLLPFSNNIGKVKKSTILDIGFNYSCDFSVRPSAKLPDILKVEPLSSFKSVGISSLGRNYNVYPDLVVIDGITNQIIDDVVLKFKDNESELQIVKNSNGFNNSKPIILPINNSNGVGIQNIDYDFGTKIARVYLNQQYSELEDFPFEILDKVLIENIATLDGKGYNSEFYNYRLFTLINIDRNLGGAQSYVEFSFVDFLEGEEYPGTFDPINSYGRIVAEKDFPIFDPILQKNSFLIGETVFSNSNKGIVEYWDSQNEYLKISTTDNFEVNNYVIGSTSNAKALISNVNEVNCDYKIKSSCLVRKGWKNETGFLNNNIQRIHDSDYYQYFSYSIKSGISYNIWNDAVSSLNHTVGFKKFSDLMIDSQDYRFSGISTSQNYGDFSGLSDLSEEINLDCYNDFDLVSENTLNSDVNLVSDKIIFNSREIQDYSESIGNRVLVIDDISSDFDSSSRPTKYSVIDIFKLDVATIKKYITFVKDRKYTSQRQILLITLLQNGSFGYLNQYGRVETFEDLGWFDFVIMGDEGNLLFYPNYYEFNSYDIIFNSYNINFSDITSIYGETQNTVEDSFTYEFSKRFDSTILSYDMTIFTFDIN